jgi:cellulose synthase/poly-beta-1,6-N-acetylglucosamine synthase-like glycosyltransferase
VNFKPKNPAISVVIPAHNEEKLIERCLLSLINQTFPREKYEIIVVDNASTDKTRKIAKRHADKVIVEPRKGLLFARQTGFEAARGETILRTDADAFVPIDWLDRAWQNFQTNQKIVALSGFYFDDRNQFFLIVFSFMSIFLQHLMFKIKGTTNWLSGPCSAFKRDAFEKIGGFDLSSDPVIEDQLGIAWRIGKLGKIGFDKSWWVWFSGRRVEKQNLGGLVGDYLIYQGLNNFYFLIFKKKPRRIFGRGWKDIRS